MSKERKKLIHLLGQEVNLENDEQLLSEFSDLRKEMQVGAAGGFSADFSDKLEEKLFADKENLEGKLVYMFKRMAIPAAAAILFLVGLNLFNTDSLRETFSYQAQMEEQVINGEWSWTEDFE